MTAACQDEPCSQTLKHVAQGTFDLRLTRGTQECDDLIRSFNKTVKIASGCHDREILNQVNSLKKALKKKCRTN